MAEPVRVVLADDHPAMRMAFRSILEANDIEVVSEAGDGRAAIDAVAATAADVVVMDVRMPVMDGIAATAALTAAASPCRVLVLTTFDDDELVHGALRAGAAGFLVKNASPEEIVTAVRRVAAGDAVLDPAVTARVVDRMLAGAPRKLPAPLADPLTERELDVWWLMAQGLSNGEIATRLAVGEATVKTHVSRVLTKLAVRDRIQAVIRAHDEGFASRPRPLG
jgi:DNA-binding NarL/FixJ family response regulator